ncbi:YwaF family protein [Nesterenkonia flava]|uniref:TIGR02206 family membrane protein n=1 Tax=Nesterenkonia flava TaxID=469799 RepID=A0ABU1FRE6_9MICC|nr:TIGR02206 family membrane protein [Nesterenkonia flava]MDR5711238.1 TIGR02206 family membrane protein [Nesterenkonia flava]
MSLTPPLHPGVAILSTDSLDTAPLGAVHMLLLGVTAVLAVLVLWGARRLRGSRAESKVYSGAGWGMLVLSVLYTGWLLLPGNWSVGQSLPLHYSDALRYVTALALIRRARWVVAITCFWGLTLNPQAMLTPHPSMLEPSVHFGFYWVLHIAVLLAALALVWGVGYRPGWKDFLWAYGIALGWAALVMPVNALLGTNYAFLNRHPDGASLLDWLGEWPVYVVWLAVLVGVVWAAMTWLWSRGSAGAAVPMLASQRGSHAQRPPLSREHGE